MAEETASPVASEMRDAPKHFTGILREVGPGLIISAIIVGSGELIVTPKLGAEEGFKLLWFIILGCLLKVFVQIELGRYAITRGRTTLEALNTLPGPRVAVSWVLWLWLAMYLCLVPQVAGMVGGVATSLSLGGVKIAIPILAVLIGSITAIVLIFGRYRLVETASTMMVAIFTITTMVAVGALQFTEFAVTAPQLVSGFTFQLPDSMITAFGAFGIIGVGASELIYYPYWCLEKGYAKRVGTADGSEAWKERARGWLHVMHIDAWISFFIYTAATIAFYILGAAILHARQLKVESGEMIHTLSQMYLSAFGQWSLWLFLIGAIAVLYSTIFGATASNARLLADALSIFGVKKYRSPGHRVLWVKISCVILPIAFTSVFLIFGNPVTLVFWGAIAQGLMLPFLAGAALYFHFTSPHRDLRAGPASLIALTLAAVLMTALGVYQVNDALQARPNKPAPAANSPAK
ncbi:MAG TPA: Nramp family divalent metal transporter [Verrucomicrobiae bacterium]|nr:Nramp family divalent metal transporter [Verrucomicrobiae bacterium]